MIQAIIGYLFWSAFITVYFMKDIEEAIPFLKWKTEFASNEERWAYKDKKDARAFIILFLFWPLIAFGWVIWGIASIVRSAF